MRYNPGQYVEFVFRYGTETFVRSCSEGPSRVSSYDTFTSRLIISRALLVLFGNTADGGSTYGSSARANPPNKSVYRRSLTDIELFGKLDYSPSETPCAFIHRNDIDRRYEETGLLENFNFIECFVQFLNNIFKRFRLRASESVLAERVLHAIVGSDYLASYIFPRAIIYQPFCFP